jgi:hypothetical protein
MPAIPTLRATSIARLDADPIDTPLYLANTSPAFSGRLWPRGRIDIRHPRVRLGTSAIKPPVTWYFCSIPERVRSVSLTQRCHHRLATPVLFSVILMVIAQTYERLCFGCVFPVFCMHVTVWTFSDNHEIGARGDRPAPTARPHGYLEPSPAPGGRPAQSQAGNSLSCGPGKLIFNNLLPASSNRTMTSTSWGLSQMASVVRPGSCRLLDGTTAPTKDIAAVTIGQVGKPPGIARVRRRLASRPSAASHSGL